MLRRLLKIALVVSIAVHCACAYRYTALRIGTVVTVPEHESVAPEQLTATVYYTAYVVTMTKGGDEAKKNNAAVEALLKGKIDDALVVLESIVAYNEPAVLNNYGVALLINGNSDSGLQYICRAAVLQPDNAYFKKNYLYLHECKK